MDFTNNLLLRRYKDLAGPVRLEESDSSGSVGMRGKVVVAESDPSDLKHISLILRSLRFRVLTALDVKSALELVRDHRPDLVLASLDLPHFDGYKLSKEMRENQLTENIPFMFIVGPGELPDRVVGHETYAHDYIQKPISVPDFKSRINALLKLSASSAEREGEAERISDPRVLKGPIPETVLAAQQGGGRLKDDLADSVAEDSLTTESPMVRALDEIMARMRALLDDLSGCLKQLEESWVEDARSEVVTGVESERLREPGSVSGGDAGSRRPRFPQAEQGEVTATGKVAGTPGLGPHTAPGVSLSGPSDRKVNLDSIAASLGDQHAEDKGEQTAATGSSLVDRFLDEYRESLRSGSKQEKKPSQPKGVDDILRSFRKSEVMGRSLQNQSRSGRAREDNRSKKPPLHQPVATGEEDSGGVSEDREVEDESDRLPRKEMKAHGVEAFLLDQVFRKPSSSTSSEESGSKLYVDACDFVLESIRTADTAGLTAAKAASHLAQRLIRSLSRQSTLLLAATDRTQGYAVSTHAVNVAILTIRLGQILSRPWEFLCRIGISGLLHEMGVSRLPARLMYRNGSLSSAEVQKLRERPLSSAGILREMGPGYAWLGEVVSQVHERENGSGVPLGLRGGQMREESKLLSAADFFEACIHERPYRTPMTGYQALYELATNGDRRFADHVIKAFIRAVSLYPFNEFVVLNTRAVGRVIDINEEDLSRPCVELLYDRHGVALDKPTTIDLSKTPELEISKSVNVRDLPS